MNEPKFTPGPWHNPQREWVADSAGNAICPMAAGKPQSECEANASLIAAAPEMYDFGQTTAESLRVMLDSMIVPPAARKLAMERIEEWEKLAKKARGE